MSSHHVVRDAQEPALLILNPQFLAHERLASLLEWSPTIVVREDALLEVLHLHIKIDAVICSREKQEEVKLLVAEQAPVTLVSPEKEESALLTGLSYLEKQGHRAVNLLLAEEPVGGDLLSELSCQEKIPQVAVLSAFSRFALCRSGKYHKWFPAQECIQLLPATVEEPVRITTSGFTNKLDQKELRAPVALKSSASGTTTISGNGPFWVKEQLA